MTPLAIAVGYRFGNFKPSAETEAALQRRSMATPVPARDLDLEAAVTEALARLKETPPDLIVTDLEMPVVDGVQFLRLLQFPSWILGI